MEEEPQKEIPIPIEFIEMEIMTRAGIKMKLKYPFQKATEEQLKEFRNRHNETIKLMEIPRLPPPKPELSIEEKKKLIISTLLEDGLDNLARGMMGDSAPLAYGLASLETEKELAKFITLDPKMLELKSEVRLLSNIEDTILIVGESGTGKEIIARALKGKRPGAFVAINCAGLPEYLIESELFGHVRGAFTGATVDKVGLFKAANKGVIFLDEIGELPITLQAKLLRFLQDKRIRPVGSNIEEELDVRVVCATHRDLETLISQNKFRYDLYNRISTFILHTSPLRDRLGDINPILGKLLKIKPPETVPLEIFMQPHDKTLPGNVRNLQQLARRYQVLIKKQTMPQKFDS